MKKGGRPGAKAPTYFQQVPVVDVKKAAEITKVAPAKAARRPKRPA